MAYDGSGNFVRVHSWQDDATAGIKIVSSRHDEEDNGFATGLSNAICRDGQAPILSDIPWSGKKITNLGNPINPGDAATKNYCDTLTGWTTSKNISGADLNGRLNFTALGGVNGVTWSNADMSWFGKAATANQTSNRLVVNSSIDGTTASPGTDLVSIDEGGRINLSSGVLSNNLSYDGTAWRTPVAGNGGYLQVGTTGINLYATDTATTTAYQTVSLRQHTLLADSAGSAVWRMTKKDGTHNLTNILQAYTGASMRWQMQLGNTTNETGSNAGSDFQIDRFDDSGTYIDTPMSIARSSGATVFTNLFTTQNIQSNSGNLVLGPTGAGAVFLRPNGAASTSGQAYVQSDGQLIASNLITGQGLSAGGGNVRAGTGVIGRAGTAGGFTSNQHNWFFASPTLYAYVDTSFTSIGTISDYRIKRNVAPLPSQWEAVKGLAPISYQTQDFDISKESDDVHWGFIAHELQEKLTATAATGVKDGESLQSPNPWTIIAALTSALQEAMLRIEALEARP